MRSVANMLEGIKTASIIFNPLAGGGHWRRHVHLDAARRVLAAAGIEADLRPTAAPGEAGQIASRAVSEGSQMIIVCGGDGTLNEVVNGMAGSQVPVALLPAGTANVLAKELGISWRIPKAAAMISSGIPVRVALGLMTPAGEAAASRYFICVAGAGADGALVHALDPAMKLKTGIISYWYEGFRQLFRYKFPKFRVVARQNSGETTVDGTLVVIGRTKHYGGPFRITTGADFFSDEFELAIFTSQNALRYLTYLPATWTGALRRQPDVHFVKTAAFRCESLGPGPVYAQLDGEPSVPLPVDFTIVPDALTLVVPGHHRSQLATRLRKQNALLSTT
jgi:diacylglycerol kinase (ATP)